MLLDRVPLGEMNLGDLPRSWALLEQLYGVLRAGLAKRDPGVLHPRMIDESLPGGRRTYMAAHRYLNIAWDNHEALLALLKHHGATQFAPWNLLRPTFEAAFYVLWLLDPEDSVERRRRGLRLEWLDEREHRLYYDDMKAIERFVTPEDRAQFEEERSGFRSVSERHDQIFGEEAAELGLEWPPPKSVNVLAELGNLRYCNSVDGSDVLLRSTWRMLSGMQHGRSSAMLRSSDRAHERITEGGVEALLSINDQVFVGIASTTNSLHQQAVMLLHQRSDSAT